MLPVRPFRARRSCNRRGRSAGSGSLDDIERLSARRRHALDRRLVKAAARILPEVDRRLRRQYGNVSDDTMPLGNKRNPVDELVYIQLSVRTPEHTYREAYRSLRRLVGGAWERFLNVSDADALRVLQPSGMACVKLLRLRAQFAALRVRFGRVTLAPLRLMTTDDAEAVLRSLPGVGPKVARCVLLYSLGRDVFPVDSHCHRVLGRLGFLPAGMHVKASHDFLQDLIPVQIRKSLHVNLIRHGRGRCLPRTPDCGHCPLLSLCPTGTMRVTGVL
jgi:endonuclease III